MDIQYKCGRPYKNGLTGFMTPAGWQVPLFYFLLSLKFFTVPKITQLRAL